MSNGPHVLARKEQNAVSGETYWTGRFTPSGKAQCTVNLEDSLSFDGSRAAYNAGAPHKALQLFRAVRPLFHVQSDRFNSRWWIAWQT